MPDGTNPDTAATYIKGQESFFSADGATVVPGTEVQTVHAEADTGGRLGALGEYELQDVLGRGGMGVVYRALQRKANRLVALKVIRPDRLGLPSDEERDLLVERFRAEAQAAAGVEHDNLVGIHEVGECDGLHYFSMQYVEGRTLAEAVRDGPLSNREAASYVEQAARGVHAAHEAGVLHRDLKPHNIIVDAKRDRAMVMDFGLAKLTETDRELTSTGVVMGTPQYMSPEQARDAAHVSTGGDVYSLGATLYHLVTGRPPFHASTAVETLRQVIDDPPVSPRKLNPAVDRDLETICLKCLEKTPIKRYASCADLADELQRFLNGEPILARPLGRIARTWRWCKRRPWTAAATGAALLSLTVAITAVIVGYIQTERSYRQVKAAQARDERSFRRAMRAVNESFALIAEDDLLNQPGLQPLRRKLFERSLAFYREFLAERGDDPSVREDAARAYFNVGRITADLESHDAALPWYERARGLHDQLESTHADSRLLLSDILNAEGESLTKLKQYAAAMDKVVAAESIRQRLLDEAPANVTYKRKLANSMMNRGLVATKQNELSPALVAFTDARKLRDECVASDPNNMQLRRNLAFGSYNLGNLLWRMKKLDEALAAFQHSAMACRRVLASEPGNLATHYQLAMCDRRIADRFFFARDGKRAAAHYEQARQRLETLATGNPDMVAYRSALAGLLINYGQLLLNSKKLDEADRCADRATELIVPLVAATDGERYRRDEQNAVALKARIQAARTPSGR